MSAAPPPAQIPAWIPTLFRGASTVNFVIGAPSMVAPRRTARLFGSPAPEPAFPMQAWSGMAFMFGFMFREIASDPLGKRALIRYGWLEKLVSAGAVTVGYRAGEAPRSSLMLLTLADWALIAPFIYAKRRLDEIAAQPPEASRTVHPPSKPVPGR